MTSLFIFRIDYRLKDNTALIECFKNSDKIICLFIFDPKQIDSKKNKYFSNNCVQFMIESLKDLYQECDKKLMFASGNPEKIVEEIHNKITVNNLYINEDYTPYSNERDTKLKEICTKLKIIFNSYSDITLNNINFPKKGDDTPYSVFTPYLNASMTTQIKKPKAINKKSLHSKLLPIKIDSILEFDKLDTLYTKNDNINVNGGRKLALKILDLIENQKDYNEMRSQSNYKTTLLSAYLKFGCLSIREVYHVFLKKLGKGNDLIKQLYWRDFYYYLIYHFPETYTKKVGLKSSYKNFPWEKNESKFKKWCQGNTGFPIVDASMIHLNTTGYMPNRSRLIVANFLTKLLRIDWTWGEKYFAQNLVDYSVSNNLGNWQWVASIGADYQNRIYNPMSQTKKADPDCLYIKTWLPQLKDIPNKDLIDMNKKYMELIESIKDYPSPIIDYKKEYHKSKELFKKYA